MSKESFLVFKSFYEPIKLLSNEDLGQLFRQIFEFQISGTEPTNTSRTFMAFQFFKNQFRLDELKYQAVCERNKGNGAKGGRKPKPTEPNPKNPVGLKEPKQPDNEKDNDNVNDKIDFSLFWNIYPRKEKKKDAEVKWGKLPIETQNKILETLPDFLRGKEVQFVPMPVTYFNAQRWDDIIIPQNNIDKPKNENALPSDWLKNTIRP